jgi:RNA polymerase sigma factor (sigma-70 family)
MTERTSSPDLEVLLGHSRWLNRLAAHLVGGGDGADDAVQETWAAALRALPSTSEDPRPWLARVLRNALSRRARAEGRRRGREQAALVGQATAQEPASLERLEAHRRLTEAVTALDEPFRTTVLMRYFEDRSAAEIARALGVPEGTVRWRTKEALDRLRARLDERHGGDRRRWMAALAPAALLRPARVIPRNLLIGAGALVAAATLTVVVAGALDRGGPESGSGGPSRWRLPRFSALTGGTPAAPAPVTVDGVVLGPDGRPVAGAVVTARPVRVVGPARTSFGTERPLPAALATTDGAGAFRLGDLPPGRYVIGAAHPQHAGAYERDVQLPRGQRLELRLGTGGLVLAGQVLDQGGGPIPRARVMAQGRWLAMFTAVTTEQGEYRLVLPEPASTLVVSAGGYAPVRLPGRFAADERRDFRLAAGARISGRVVSSGRGMGGARVRLLPVGGSARDRWEEEVTTDGEGRFTIADLPAFSYRPFVRQGALVTRAAPVLALRAGGEEKVELALEPGVSVRGHLRDSGGRPVVGSGVGAIESGERPFTEVATGMLADITADGAGGFLLEGLPPGKLDLLPAALGYTGRKRTVELGESPVVQVDLELAAAAGVVGVLQRADGSPAVNAEVRGRSRPPEGRGGTGAMGRSDGSGRFEVLGLGAGSVTLISWSGREVALLAPFPLQAGERKEVTIRLAPGAFASGHVRSDDGRPAAGVKVSGMGGPARPAPGESLHYDIMLEPVLTDATGAFTIGPFLPGRITVAAFAPGERQVTSSNARPNQATAVVSAGQQVTGLEMVLSTGRGRIAGTTVGPTGAALPGATLIAVLELPGQTPYPEDGQARRSTSGGAGEFVLEGLAQGTFTVFGSHPDHPDVRVSNVKAGTADAAVRFARPAALTGVVRNKHGGPVKEYAVSLALAIPPGQRAGMDLSRLEVTDPRGAFKMPRLAAGRYQLIATTRDGLVARAAEVPLGEGETRRVSLVAEPGAIVVGRVVDDVTGAAAAGVKVNVRLPGIRSETVTGGDGGFRLGGLLPREKVRVSSHREQDVRVGHLEVETGGPGTIVEVGTIRLRPRDQPAP